MLTEVMDAYGPTRPPISVEWFETEHSAQLLRDLKAAVMAGRLIALTAVIGSGKTLLARRLKEELERENKVIVSRSLALDKNKISVPLLLAALFYDLSAEKQPVVPTSPERRERELQELFRKARKPVVMLIDDAQDLHHRPLTALKRLMELADDSGAGQLSVLLIGKPKLRNDLKRPNMREIGDRTIEFAFDGLRNQQRRYVSWVLEQCLADGIAEADVLEPAAADRLAARLRTPMQIGRYLARAFEAGFAAGVKPLDLETVDGVLSARLDNLEAELTRHGYDVRSLSEQFGVRQADVMRLLRGTLDDARSRELVDEMRLAGLPM